MNDHRRDALKALLISGIFMLLLVLGTLLFSQTEKKPEPIPVVLILAGTGQAVNV